MEWMILPYRRYFDFRGRSCRKEYWMFTLLWVIVLTVLVTAMIATLAAGGPGAFERSMAGTSRGEGVIILFALLLAVFYFLSWIPGVAVTVRRFHDQGHSGWFYLLGFIPYVGGLVLIVFMCLDGVRGRNQWGPDPKDPTADADVFA